MGRRNSGCGFWFVALTFGLPIVAGAIAAVLLALTAPAIVPFLITTDPAQFAEHGTAWWCFLGAAPFAALLLVGQGHPKRRTARRRRVDFRRLLPRAGILLLAVNVTALVLLLDGNVAHGPHAARQTAILFGGSGAAGAAVLIAFRVRDRWFPAGERVKPVTLAAVRAATVEAEQTLQQVRANNLRVSRQAAAVERQLQAARLTLDFAGLCELHFESRGCADNAYQYYDMSRDVARGLAGMVVRARATATMRVRSETNATTGRRERPNRAAMTAAAASLARTRASIGDEVGKGLTMVKSLNARTADLKCSIRDNCGNRGRRWFDELEARTAARRQAAGRPA
ncbi:hypothetical protein SAMN04489727_6969 [Amycolatopsis tolypomycina]|uniref:Uncharacterized protein n=1 Tax=Amycolatopsis tolypomycina TaxID=208445 RepID=A0A1H4YWT2_9PSEU|nr:hypothetical protein [Amycolatopsis tolypomycina]SED22519.1 hypothetical protein SAMN04489727_6969 [Amycolatopsis tolypomycina]